ncbi:FAD-binding and (Fe-S)-binding domain-containing protein [Corynebacterium accolens]|uniref:FAD-binding and (Fe-S)-binding domain-containing protein n=1 Tax=Corynebacterium accolens TaxID=38284 RepID=UPI0025437550|nr:FAD-binding and (Fe-S)-binding domain-containing protein [Corynebacterium accolens]MDK4336018.1 FAD-binding and (Fe-S)-binding domain-containing protein [Corynebacterium accolens]
MTTGTLKIDQLFPQDGPEVKTGIIDRVAYASDASHYLYTPKAVIEARSAEHVAAIFKAGRQQGIPVTLRSGGTSLAGQASGEGYLVDVRKHFRGIEVLDDGKRVRVQPGATVRQVNARLGLRNRKLGPDPASEAACTIGGVVANNSSGMACGTEFNTYNTLESLTFVLPSGTVINTADADADRQFQAQEPELVDTLTRLQRRVRDNQESVDIIRRHFQLKNTMGYGLNSFLDFDSPVKLFEHLLVGSEGTLAFIAEAVFRTVHISSLTTTTVAVFNNLFAATKALPSLVETGAATLELMDSASIRVGQGFDKVPQAITGFDVDSQAALLIEYQSDDKEELREKENKGSSLLRELDLQSPAEFSADIPTRTAAWNFRKGLYAQVAEARPSGTTALLEDVVVPVGDLADTCSSLQELFTRYSYDDAVIFGHAKDGNIHFLLTDRFEGDSAIGRYNNFNEEMVDLVLSAEGNLKAEHGTGRAMAPYVRRQYGDELYEVMQLLKRACDPAGTMNPGVILDDDPDAHITNIKLNPTVEEEIDPCVECGYCEPVCPSRDLTLTPRQRIVVRRARQRAQESGDTHLVAELDEAYEYMGIDTCAVDSMCLTACPVGIDTGKFIKKLRHENAGAAEEKVWSTAAKNWQVTSRGAATALTGAHMLPGQLVTKVTDVARSLIGPDTVPGYPPELGKGGKSRERLAGRVGDRYAQTSGVYLPACVNSMFAPQGEGMGATQAFITVLERAGIALEIPKGIEKLCCGTPWASKGMRKGHDIMEQRVRESIMEATDNTRLPVIVDASSCTAGFQEMLESIGITVIDALSFTADTLLPRLETTQPVRSMTIHPTCSAFQLGMMGDVEKVARAAATEVHIPTAWTCCGYAGDRGMLHPELTESATRAEAAQVTELGAQYHASTNRTCELGMTRATGEDYHHVLEMLERATR